MTALGIYIVIGATLGLGAALHAGSAAPWHERRQAARIALTCWVWPIWLGIALAHALRALVRIAR